MMKDSLMREAGFIVDSAPPAEPCNGIDHASSGNQGDGFDGGRPTGRKRR